MAVEGLQPFATEDRMRALGAAAASFGAVGLFHIVGVTPEAQTIGEAFGGLPPEETVVLTPDMVRTARSWLSTTSGDTVDAVAVGSPHLSHEEMITIANLLGGRRVILPFYAHTGRHVLRQLEASGRLQELEAAGVTVVTDTCIVVTPILPASSGVLLTNSGKFANYAPGNTGWSVVYGSLTECIESALHGKLVRDEELWS